VNNCRKKSLPVVHNTEKGPKKQTFVINNLPLSRMNQVKTATMHYGKCRCRILPDLMLALAQMLISVMMPLMTVALVPISIDRYVKVTLP
jgi:hypothetical protein